jgi:hypothetical protein
VTIFWLMRPFMLAGSGLRTEATFQGQKGLHGSTYFTLSLPVSRLKLFAIRAAFGFLETAGIVVGVCCIAAVIFPELKGQTTLADGLRYVATLFSAAWCTTAYRLSYRRSSISSGSYLPGSASCFCRFGYRRRTEARD